MREPFSTTRIVALGLGALVVAGGLATWLLTTDQAPDDSASASSSPSTPASSPTTSDALLRERWDSPASDRSDRALGVNLSIPSFGGDTPFTDAMHNAVPFRDSEGAQVEEVDAQGWPLEVADGESVWSTVAELSAAYLPAGDYTLTYVGDGDVEIESAAGELRASVTADGTTTATFAYDPAGVSEPTITVVILRSDVDDPVRDLHLYLPGYSGAENEPLFHPDFLDLWSSYGAIRTMQAQSIWDFAWDEDLLPTDVDWEDRATVDQFAWGERWPYEAMIEMANALDQDLWINVPHTATDAYMTEMATLLRDGLEPGRHLYVEFTNECWNGVSNAHQYARTQGVSEGLGDLTGSDDGYSAALEWCAIRTADADRLFTEVYAATDREDEVVSVMGVFTSVPYSYVHEDDDGSLAGALYVEHPDLGVPVHELIDSIAATGYFGGAVGAESVVDQVESWTVDEVFAYLLDDTLPAGTESPDEFEDSIPDLMAQLTTWKTLADGLDLGLHVYEAGPHLVAQGNETVRSLTYDVVDDPRMGDALTAMLDGMREVGVDQIALYTSAEPSERDLEWTRFGLIPNTFADESAAIRWQAAEEWGRSHAAWWIV